MVALAHMESPRIKAWLGGIEPAWTVLDWVSFRALAGFSPVLSGEPIEFNTDLSPEEFKGSAITQHAIILLKAGMESDGLKLTATGKAFLKTHLYRRTPLFDRFFSFRVTLEKPHGLRH